MKACPTDAILFDQGHIHSNACGVKRSRVSTWAAADYYKVIRFRHVENLSQIKPA
jgi:hypothetical protein